jgi:hypothetical protein
MRWQPSLADGQVEQHVVSRRVRYENPIQCRIALTLICRSSYRGVVEFLRDLLGVPIGIGTVHHVLQSATRQAGIANHDQDLSGILVGLHDEIFQGRLPVLVKVCVPGKRPPGTIRRATAMCFTSRVNAKAGTAWRLGVRAAKR